MSLFNRDNAFSITITNPDDPNDSSSIIKTIQIGDDLYLFKEDSIYRLLTAETIDPKQEESDTRHSYEKLYSIGCQSEYVSDIIIQADILLKDGPSREEALMSIWKMNQYVLTCHDVCITLDLQIKELSHLCRTVQVSPQTSTVPPLPKIDGLNEMVGTFLRNSKLFLINIFRFLRIYYSFDIKDRQEAHFDNHLKNLKETLGEEHYIVILIEMNISWIRILSECRNAIEHPEVGQSITVFNIRRKPGNIITMPEWQWDLTKKLKVSEEARDLLIDLTEYCLNIKKLLNEVLIITCSEFTIPKYMEIIEIPTDLINHKCPVRYDLELKEEFFMLLSQD